MNHPSRIITIIALSLMLTTSFLAFTADTNAMSYLERTHCDYVFSESHFTNVDRKDYPRCEKRWDYLTKRIISSFPN